MVNSSYDMALIRIDNRLVHGQILEAWVPFVKAKSIMVVNDNAACDVYCETVIRLAVHSEIEVIVSTVEDFAKNYTYQRNNGKKAIVLFASMDDAFRAYNLGFHFNQLNIGNIYNENYKFGYGTSVFLCDNDIREIIELFENKGVMIEVRRIPRERAVNAKDVLKDYCEITH